MAAKRVRRAPEEARRAILDAAEARMRDVGIDGLRLQDLAKDVGISHPAVLHHFGSREQLVEAVVERAMRTLEAELLDAVTRIPPQSAPHEVIELVFDRLGSRGSARLLAWLALTDHLQRTKTTRDHWMRIVDATHALRVAGDPQASREDTAYTLVLCALALFGEALVGDYAFSNAGLDRAQRGAFRPWLGTLVLDRMSRPRS